MLLFYRTTFIFARGQIILPECQAFYIAFLQLEKQLKNSGLHNDKPDDNLPPLLSVPYMVNGAFASELALKYMLIHWQM